MFEQQYNCVKKYIYHTYVAAEKISLNNFFTNDMRMYKIKYF